MEQLCHFDLQSLIFRHAIEEITESFANYSYNIIDHFLGLRSIFKDCFKHLWPSLRRTLNITGMSVASSSKLFCDFSTFVREPPTMLLFFKTKQNLVLVGTDLLK